MLTAWHSSFTRVDDRLLAQVDALVDEGVAATRSDAVRLGLVALVESHRRQQSGMAIVDGYRRHPQQEDELAGLNDATRPDRRGAVVALPAQGEIWWAEAGDKRRPVLVVTRTEAIAVLTGIVVAPVTRTVRNIPTEVLLGESEGLHVESAASFDNLQRIRRSALTERIGNLGLRREEICASIRALADC